MKLLNPDGKMNMHSHTCFCDGKDHPEDMVKKAIDLGFKAIGFSGHEYAKHDLEACMSRENTVKYREEVLAAREKYKGIIKVGLGIERDYYGESDGYPYDYVIGSVHYIKKDGVFIGVDNTAEIMEEGVREHFNGDYKAYVAAYYDTVADVVNKTGADIVGHFDLVTKFNEGNRYFDEHATWYKKLAIRALGELAKSRPLIEINTGAMAKGYRTRPYPDGFIIDEIKRLGLTMILSSDCHDKEKLNYGFDSFINGRDTVEEVL